MKRDDVQFRVRLPVELKSTIDKMCREEDRNQNSQIINLLKLAVRVRQGAQVSELARAAE